MLSVCRLCLDLEAFLVLAAEGDLEEFFSPDPARILGRTFLSWVDAASRQDLAHALLASSRQLQSRVISVAWSGGRRVTLRLCPEPSWSPLNRVQIQLEAPSAAGYQSAA
jgi:hypothetical protein